MRAGQPLRCVFWAALYCLLYMLSTVRSEEELMDFDFTDLKEIDWNYDSDNGHASRERASDRPIPGAKSKGKLSASSVPPSPSDIAFSFDDADYFEENQVRPYDLREHVLRSALSRALTNGALRQKFVEVMPILRVLTPSQRLALSALISAQIHARQSQQLKLEQVRMIFGNDKKLLIPIVYDIANLVRSSAHNYLQFDLDATSASILQHVPSASSLGRRTVKLTADEAATDDHLGTVAVDAGTAPQNATDAGFLEDFFADMSDDVLDPQSINEALQDATLTTMTTPASAAKRARRSATPAEGATTTTAMAETTAFVHKLRHIVPLSVKEEDLLKGAAGRSVKLNTTAFLVPEEESQTPTDEAEDRAYYIIEDLAFASLNGSTIHLNGNADGDETNGEAEIAPGATAGGDEEPLPRPEELIAGPRYRVGSGSGGKLHLMRSKMAAHRKRVQLRPRLNKGTASSKKCERFTASMCIRTDDYPLDQIMGSIRRHKNAMSALLAEYYDKPPPTYADEFEDFGFAKKRREDDAVEAAAVGAGPEVGVASGMCQTIVRYARPQKARSAAGEWKYIVNTGQHKQTLRLEKCTNPQESCSYLAQSYRSHCAQVYNYHRLLSWDKARGLHVDIFKVPTCCSCQVDGYRQQFPPLGSTGDGGLKSKEYTPSDVYATINEELNYNDEEEDADDDELSYQYGDGGYGAYGRYHHHNEDVYAGNELLLGTKKVRTRVYTPLSSGRPTVGSYLSPPDDHHPPHYSQGHMPHGHMIHTHSMPTSTSPFVPTSVHRRRPYKSLGSGGIFNEARVDLEIAPSETYLEQEVNLFGASAGTGVDKARAPPKRKRIYSVPHLPHHTAAASGSGVVAGGGGGFTAHAHQTPAAIPTHYTSNNNQNTNIGAGAGIGIGKSKTRFHATATTSAAAPAATKLQQQRISSATAFTTTTRTASTRTLQPAPPVYHVNSIYGAKKPNATNGAADGSVPGAGLGYGHHATGTKRINYSYHPIIDFFENHNNRRSTSASSSPHPSARSDVGQQPYRHKIPKANAVESPAHGGYQSARERRIGLGAGSGAGGAVGVVIGSGSDLGGDNAWLPMVSDV